MGSCYTFNWQKSIYYVSFIDDFTKLTWIYLLKNISDVFQKFHDFQHHVERLFDKKILGKPIGELNTLS